MNLILYHDWSSTCSQKVRLALAEKGLDLDGAPRAEPARPAPLEGSTRPAEPDRVESRIVRLRRFEHLAPEFLALNPEAMVPVLIHDGFVCSESSVITEYLDAVFPDPPLQPADPRGRAEVGMWTRFIDQVTSPAIKKPSFARNLVGYLQSVGVAAVEAGTARMPSPGVRDRWLAAARGGYTPHELEIAHADLRRTLDRMQAALARTDWLVPGRYTLADIHALPFVERLAHLPDYDLNDWPAVVAWRARVRARPAFGRAQFVEPVAAA